MNFFGLFNRGIPPLVQQCLDDMEVMLHTTREMFMDATDYLLKNKTLTYDLSVRDDEVNEKERSIRTALLQHFSINPEDEMVLSLMLMSVVQDAERIGDLTKSIAKAAALADAPRSGRHVHALTVIRDHVATQFDRARKGLVEGDVSLARAVLEENDRVKELTRAAICTLASAKDLTVNEGVVLAMSARMIGRVGSHLSNIASSVALPFDQMRRSATRGDDK